MKKSSRDLPQKQHKKRATNKGKIKIVREPTTWESLFLVGKIKQDLVGETAFEMHWRNGQYRHRI